MSVLQLFRISTLLILVTLTTLLVAKNDDDYFGVYVGHLSNSVLGINGEVYLADRNVIYVRHLHLQQQANETDISFVVSSKEDIIPLRQVYKKTNQSPNGDESTLVPVKTNFNHDIINAHLFFVLPEGATIETFTFFGIFTSKEWKYLASVKIDKAPPKPYCCLRNPEDPNSGILGSHYDAHTGPIEVLNSKTIVLKAFRLDGISAPDAWIFTGNGSTPITRHSGRKAMVLGRDTPKKQCSIKDHLLGDSSLTARLLHGQNIYNIRFISIFCYQYDVNFGNIAVDMDPSVHPVPLYLPPIKGQNDDTTAKQDASC